MKVICAWCGKFLGGDKNAAEVTHGICDDCQKAMLKLLEESRKDKAQ